MTKSAIKNTAISREWEMEIVSGEPGTIPSTVAAAWDRLALANPQSTVFQERGFVTLWSGHRARATGGRLLVCHARSVDDEAEVIVPMVLLSGSPRSLWIRRYLAAGEPNFDFQDPLVSSIEAFVDHRTAFWKMLTSELTKAGCRRFTIARTHREFLPEQCTKDASEQTWKSSLSGFQSLDQFLSARSSNLRGDVNRRIRRMNDAGTVVYEIFSPTQMCEANDELRVMQEAYEELWDGQPAAGLFQTRGLLSWYRALIEEYLPTGTLHFSRLLCGSSVIAWHFGFLHHGVLHWYKPTYKKAFAHLSPGKVLLAKVIEEGIRKGWRTIDYGPGMEAYKQQWANESSAMFRWEWNHNGPVCRLVNYLRRVRLRFVPTPK